MKSIFETAATYEFSPPPEEVVLVSVNCGAVLTTNSPSRYLVTSHTNVCSGLALVSDEACALTHIYSDMKFYVQGRQQVEEHARFAWHKFENILPDCITFKATAFGGRDSFSSVSSKFPGWKAIDAYMMKAEIAEKEYTAIENSRETQQLQASILDLNKRDKISELNLEDSLQLYSMQKKLSDMLDAPYRELNQEPYNKTGLYMASQVSRWLGDAFYKSALDFARIEESQDHRFYNAPHDVIVDCQTGRVVIGQTEKNTPLPLPYNRGYHEADKLFDDFGLQALPA
ncbi:MAG: hypothetical protein DI586_00245 [Micavibrio aeruginosavorus]|uniref:Uncharacterized protein n=1 Tax=Micavibrio aeruginosavorus TaxID=349221 RepID=A0A2W5FUN6_9BACT|nr:MAG: hypothetical protein DI586_00245 [Micavibrio aeruginosavorus]